MRHLLGATFRKCTQYSLAASFSWKRQSEMSVKQAPPADACGPQPRVLLIMHPLSVRASAAPLSQSSPGSMHGLGSYNQVMQMTPAPSMTLPIEHSSRPTLGFPLGTALLLLVIFALSGMFSCCYHWDKLRSLLRSRHPAMFQESEHAAISSIASSPSKTTPDHKLENVGKECGLPVIMPGDKVPKFFARPCPHETCLPEGEKIEVPLETRCSDHEPSVSICIHESTAQLAVSDL